jgi:hypothetical protein
MTRHRRRLTRDQKFVLSAVAVGLLVAAGSGHGAAAGRAAGTLTAKTVPAGSSYTPASWAVALLAAGSWPQTACNAAAVTAWENAEGGNWANGARFNPLDTTQPEPGSYPMNSAGVQAFASWQSGFTATLATLGNGNYGAILSALSAGGSAQAVADAVAASPWGTAPFTASC